MAALKELSKGEKWAYDERILGSGSFVETVLRQAEPERALLSASNEERQQRFEHLVHQLCETGGIGIEELTGGSRRKNVVTVRRAVCYLATRKIGMTSASVARQLNISGVAVLKAVDKGLESVELLGVDELF
ncbi:MAG: hypothetical protein JXX29_21055 [Deltaproteobacteria bacterium]|nr:hypothetical protein [Deltaproteobacteria bacterium]MBN2674184.1 hypothetical protein [Deltaproteobacteria bacterium]